MAGAGAVRTWCVFPMPNVYCYKGRGVAERAGGLVSASAGESGGLKRDGCVTGHDAVPAAQVSVRVSWTPDVRRASQDNAISDPGGLEDLT